MVDWPAHDYEVRPWRPIGRSGTRADRTLGQVTVALPPRIADLSFSLGGAAMAETDAALAEIITLDRTYGEHLESLGMLLLRTESVASSKIEYIQADADDYARAVGGSRANSSATSMVSATTALSRLLAATDRDGRITAAAVLDAHAALMADETSERDHAGQWRRQQNWIGGSDYSPRNALYVPPPPETVEGYMADLFEFANRDDLPVLAQAAVTHAQFESVHPFIDGNGRIGRGLVNAVLRRRRTTSRTVVPLASALVARRETYFDRLDDYRAGDPSPIIRAFAAAARISAAESATTAQRLAAVPAEWDQAAGPVRADSATARLLGLLPGHPVLSAGEAVDLVGGAASSVYAAIDRLHDVGVLRPLTTRRRHQIWGATRILDELDDLGTRVARAAR